MQPLPFQFLDICDILKYEGAMLYGIPIKTI
ncbi:Uncharacterised protein [Staphylococcus agnetis]|nr:Uncharacterised protein [Staphylococcus agnetis]